EMDDRLEMRGSLGQAAIHADQHLSGAQIHLCQGALQCLETRAKRFHSTSEWLNAGLNRPRVGHEHSLRRTDKLLHLPQEVLLVDRVIPAITVPPLFIHNQSDD